MNTKEYYMNLQKQYLPDNLRFIFILESPPVSGLYFYDENGKTSEPLFTEMMKLLNIKASSKQEGLCKFQEKGYLLKDATYRQVNELKGKERDNTILEDYKILVEDLKEINPTKKIPLILVKANICKLLERKLIDDGFGVLNNGVVVPFPSTGQQKRFHKEIGKFYKVDKTIA